MGHVFDCTDENVKEVARFLADTCPSLDSLMDVGLNRIRLGCDSLIPLQTYLEADDPDMGIEEEYHPKNDQ